MATYGINRGINKSWEVAGLVAGNVYYFAAAFIGTFVLFGVLFAMHVSFISLIVICGIVGGFACMMVFRMNAKYGEHGLMKALARRSSPKMITNRQSRLFIHLNEDSK